MTACAWWQVGLTVLFPLGILAFPGALISLMYRAEAGYWWGLPKRWQSYTRGSDRWSGGRGHMLEVGLRRGDQTLVLGTVDMRDAEGEQQLHEQLAAARERAIALNVADRAARRRLPA